MIKDAIAAANSSDATLVRDALEKIDNRYVTGNIRFDSKRNPVKSAVVVELVKENNALVAKYKATVNP
jgi:branched-chain amino acid transport system substrate-binding protein